MFQDYSFTNSLNYLQIDLLIRQQEQWYSTAVKNEKRECDKN